MNLRSPEKRVFNHIGNSNQTSNTHIMSQPKHIYRAKNPEDVDPDDVKRPRPTRRMPGNVPYLVDNLWAWTRPDGYPDRRASAYASPTVDQAIKSAGGDDVVAYRVVFAGEYNLAQLGAPEDKGFDRSDARYHPDCDDLVELVRKTLDNGGKTFSWATQPVKQKQIAAQLYCPCLTGEEVDHIFKTVDVLGAHRDEIYNAVTFWDDVTLIEGDRLNDTEKGELFFEYPGGYMLKPIE
jgi:hypothetical protein